MNFVESSWTIEHYDPIEDVARIARAARVCYMSPELKTFEEQCDFLQRLRTRDPDNPHMTPFEHSSLSVRFITNRGITHELVRHRIASPNEQSTRYCTYIKDKFNNSVTFIRDHTYDGDPVWEMECQQCEDAYFRRLRAGHTVDESRGALNNDVKSEIIITANYRELMHILQLRSDKACHYQMQEIMRPLKEYLKEDLPCVFGGLK
jgi:thymidylate synthase (FAD)